MQGVTRQRSELAEPYHNHRGESRVLVPDGVGAWRYFMLTREQGKFWRSLSSTERSFLTHVSKETCFVCALRDVMVRQERFESSLHRALMSFLLTQTG
jgi:hypothetical protein